MKTIPLLLTIGIIIWSRPDGGVSITTVASGSSQQEADRLKQIGNVPPDWEAVSFDSPIRLNKSRRNYWRWDRQDGEIKDDLPNPVGEIKKAPKVQ